MPRRRPERPCRDEQARREHQARAAAERAALIERLDETARRCRALAGW